jgi:hypothetical protein
VQFDRIEDRIFTTEINFLMQEDERCQFLLLLHDLESCLSSLCHSPPSLLLVIRSSNRGAGWAPCSTALIRKFAASTHHCSSGYSTMTNKAVLRCRSIPTVLQLEMQGLYISLRAPHPSWRTVRWLTRVTVNKESWACHAWLLIKHHHHTVVGPDLVTMALSFPWSAPTSSSTCSPTSHQHTTDLTCYQIGKALGCKTGSWHIFCQDHSKRNVPMLAFVIRLECWHCPHTSTLSNLLNTKGLTHLYTCRLSYWLIIVHCLQEKAISPEAHQHLPAPQRNKLMDQMHQMTSLRIHKTLPSRMWQ